MFTNESNLDRGLRAVAGLALAVAAFAVGAGSTMGIILIVLAVILLVTAAVGFCPLYRLLGLRTNKEAISSTTPH
jgi:hypothetical protein